MCRRKGASFANYRDDKRDGERKSLTTGERELTRSLMW